jgi:beta-galactosidase
MRLRVAIMLAAVNPSFGSISRTAYSLDHNWKFSLSAKPPLKSCPEHTWTIPLDGHRTLGLKRPGNDAISEEHCAKECCSEPSCTVYQFCNSTICGYGPKGSVREPACFIGTYEASQTSVAPGWHAKARPLPPPSPPQTACTEAWCRPSTDDSGWRNLSVPHDFVVEGTFSESADMAHGFLPYAVGYYRRAIQLPKVALSALRSGTHEAFLEFDGAQAHSTVFLDGQLLGTHASGYTPFRLLLPPHEAWLGPQGTPPPVLAVRVDATQPDSWWYDGGGLYRHVRLLLAPRLRLDLESGVYTPSKLVGGINQAEATADAQLDARLLVVSSSPSGIYGADEGGWDDTRRSAAGCTGGSSVHFTASAQLVSAATGAVVGISSANGTVAPGCNASISLPPIVVKNAKLWSPERPSLYEVTVSIDGVETGRSVEHLTPVDQVSLAACNHMPPPCNHIFHPLQPYVPPPATICLTPVDQVSLTVGFRAAAWDATRGFILNGVPTKILGVANHQDFAGVGVAVPDALQAYRVAKLKQMGVNAWRTAHNAPTPSLLDAADRIGMLVWDENHRNGQDSELTRLVLRDRHHPSIIIWSICNEKLCDTADSMADARRLHDLFHALDPEVRGARGVRARVCAYISPALFNSATNCISPISSLLFLYVCAWADG